MAVRIGFYICHCGINIAQKVRVEEVGDFARKLSGVVVARDYKFMCSDPGQAMIEKDIAELRLGRVVVASCSPRLHGKTFMGACARAGLNPYCFQMASVREQVSWVTEDEDEATDKAKSLVSAAVGRVHFHERLEARKSEVHPDMLVVGGGIAGMQAALDMANGGFNVYLVERDTTIGGHMLQFDKTFPTLDCAACIGTPKMVEVGQHPNIELLTNSEVEEITGFVGSYTVAIRRKPRYVREGVCTGCGECAKVCPVTIPNSWDEGLGERKAVGRTFPQAIPITFQIEKKDRAPCAAACPAGVNVQGYVQLIGQGKYQEALSLIMRRLPLPGVLGRVCPRFCESRCRRSDLEGPVAIRALKRFVADRVDFRDLPAPAIGERSERIAVIGSGPAGLTVAYYLRLKGYRVTLFEALGRLGGMLRAGIPDYRLPPGLLDEEIENVLSVGIEVRTNARLGRDFILDDLKSEGFAAAFLGVGAHASASLRIPGESDSSGAMDAVAFLREINLGRRTAPGRRVAVIGGGNVAVDAARVALRVGAESVVIVYRRTREEMPACREEIEGALEEGVELRCLASPAAIESENGKTVGLVCIENELGEPDDSGRRRPVPVEGSRFVLDCDAVVSAIGQAVDDGFARGAADLKLSPARTVLVDERTMQTSIPWVFAAGDAVSGPAAVVDAVGAGHRAVEAIHRFLNGGDLSELEAEVAAGGKPGGDWADIPEGLPPTPRAETLELEPSMRTGNFEEIDLGLGEEEARLEASRCVNCGVCSECMECVSVCEAKAIDHAMKEERLRVKVGGIVLATGYDILDPSPMGQYGYGRYPNVFTALEFERLSNATGPTGGKILMRGEDGRFESPPESVALLHCIGSRDSNYHEYCSRVCCMYALKYTHLIKEKVGRNARVFDFYIDMRCFGKGYEEFYRRCQEEGTVFVRGKVAEITDEALTASEEGKLVAVAEDTLSGRKLRVPVDMAILCTAIEARSDAASVGRVFGVSQGMDGFFLEQHPKLAPLDTATEGVFLAGCCQKPMDIPDTVSQASGAAAKAMALATLGEVEIPPTISRIDPDICAGCRVCIDLCPYGAIEFDARRGVSVVNPALCKGCGSCSAFCPSGAARSRHFQPRQIFAEIDGILDATTELGRESSGRR